MRCSLQLCCPLTTAGSHTKWKPADGFADNLSKFMTTIQGQAYQVGHSPFLKAYPMSDVAGVERVTL